MTLSQVRARRLTLDAMLLGCAMILSWLEAVLPLSLAFPLPGIKLGLANIAITLCFFMISPADAVLLSLTRVLLSSILFSTISGFWFSFAGAALALAGMFIAKYFLTCFLSFYGISVMCAALHSIGQIVAAVILFGNTALFSYLSLLLVFSVVCGLITGAVITPLARLKVFGEYKCAK